MIALVVNNESGGECGVDNKGKMELVEHATHILAKEGLWLDGAMWAKASIDIGGKHIFICLASVASVRKPYKSPFGL